jgi:glycosyltransferase involved in cell wall biosynthesis
MPNRLGAFTNDRQGKFLKMQKDLSIWLLQTGEPWPLDRAARKMRTAILANKLVQRGHSVLWWTSAFDHFRKAWLFRDDTEIHVAPGFNIIALKGAGYKRNISLSRFIDHRMIARKFKKWAVQKARPDIVIASLPSHDLAYEAVLFAQENGLPTIIDIRDQWPDIFLDLVPPSLKKIARWLFHRDFLMTQKSMQLADSLVAVTETFLDWGLEYAQRQKSEKDRIFYLGGRRRNPTTEQHSVLAEKLENRFVVTFIGTFASYHNPSVLVTCAEKIREPDICFVLAGDGELLEAVKERASSLANVIFPGWLNEEDIETLLNCSHVGICPTTRSASLIPNKFFSYLSAGLPVVSAFGGELKKIIEQCEVGFYYPPNDADALARGIIRLYDDATLRRKMSENAHEVFNRIFDADRIYEEYAQHIEKMASPENRKS